MRCLRAVPGPGPHTRGQFVSGRETRLVPIRRCALIFAIAVLAAARAVVAAPSGAGSSSVTASTIAEYHGWQIDLSHVKDEPRNTVVAAITHQLDLVENVAMAQDIRTFMRSVPITAWPGRDYGTAHYDASRGGIDVRYLALDPKQPMILRELMLAFYGAHMKTARTDIQRYFEQAKASGTWSPDADIVRDMEEFFASTATVYVYGNMDRAPFTQGKLQASQPEYWTWLGTVFDGFHGCE